MSATGTDETELKAISRTLSPLEVRELADRHPGLSLDPDRNVIAGELHIQASYQGYGKGLLINSPRRRIDRIYLEDDFELEIRLTYEPSYLMPWPPVYETGGRAQRIMQEQQVPKEDLHFFSMDPDINQCCLGLQNTDDWKGILPFLDEIVIPFFYRLSYASKFGADRAESDLWSTYSHIGGFDAAAQQYISELKQIKKLKHGNNKPCPCASGKKYRVCHKAECDAL